MLQVPQTAIGSDDHLLWQKDRYLSVLQDDLQAVRLLSLDIFDTLLFRTCANPSDIFMIVAEKAHRTGHLVTSVSPAAFKEMRIRAEFRARERQTARTGFGEVTLDLIYEEIPESLGSRDALARLEIEVEAEACYVNPHVASLLYACQKAGIPVALLSDMYLSSDQLRTILASAGLDLACVDTILVSSEEQEGKSSGHLFARLQALYPQINASAIVHIGDNEPADVSGAAKAGIRGLHYPVIPEHFESIHHWEYIRHGDVLPEWKSLRKLAAASGAAEKRGEKERLLYEFGTDVIGPFLHTLCEWVLDICVQENISCVHPLMREAYLLAPMLEHAARQRGVKLQVKPVYVSRQATFMAGLEHFGIAEFAYLTGIHGLTVNELFEVLGIDAEQDGRLQPYLHETIEACKSISLENGEIVHKLLREVLLGETMQERIEASIQRHRKLFIAYLTQSFGTPERLVTIDIGFQGTIQSALEKIVRLAGLQPQMMHLLAVGSNRVDEFRLQGMDIRSMLRAGSGGSDIPKRIARTPAFLEELMMGAFGSTLRYSEEASGIAPVLAKLYRTDEEYAMKQACQEGALTFQSYYAYLLRQKEGRLVRASRLPEEWAKPIHRALAMPKPQEAQLLGDLTHQDNFGTEYIAPICGNVAEEWYGDGPEAFLNACNYAPSVLNVNWPQGMATRRFPYYLYRYYLRLADSFGPQAMMFDIIQKVKEDGVHSLTLYGTGAFAEQLLKMAWFHGLHIPYWIDPAIDHGTAPWGRFTYSTLERVRDQAEQRGETAGFLVATLSELQAYPALIRKAFEGSEAAPVLYELRPSFTG